MEKEKKKISVIVPIYNVQKYVEKCVESIMRQTYKELEIILVDDGATDNSPELCEQLAKRDQRIKVIHKINGGLSDARNAGLEVATGEYIGFVDGDDYIEPDMYQLLVDNLEEYDADISCCRYTCVWEDGHEKPVGNTKDVDVYRGIEALKEYIYGKTMDPFVWNKLYKSKIINGEEPLRFIEGILGEDNPFVTELLKKEYTVVLAGESKYNYLQQRKGAITNSKLSQGKIDSVYWWDTLRKECIEKYPELEKYALRRQMFFYVGLYNVAYADVEYQKEAENIQRFASEYVKEILKSDVCEKTMKIAVLLLAKAPVLYRGVMRMYKKVIGKARL